jgi:hypothetical protein
METNLCFFLLTRPYYIRQNNCLIDFFLKQAHQSELGKPKEEIASGGIKIHYVYNA